MTGLDVVVRQRPLSEDFQDLCALARSAVQTWPPNGYTDDVAVLVNRQPRQLNLTLIAEPAALSEIRAALRDWLESAAVDDSTSSDLLLAVCEAASNSIEHSHSAVFGPPQSVHIRIEATYTVDLFEFTVSDNGRWRTPGERGNRGHGISLMQALTTSFSIDGSDEGTTVHLRKRLTS